MAKNKYAGLPDDVVLDVCDQFLQGTSATDVADRHGLTREKVYPILGEARRRGFIKLTSPPSQSIRRRLSDIYRHPIESIELVEARGKQTLDHVATIAAQRAHTLIEDYVRDGKEEVHIGFAAGATTQRVAQRLAQRVRTGKHPPKTLGVHALTPGFSVRQPQISPISFFGYFDDPNIDLQCYGLHATPMVAWNDYGNATREHGVKESFEARKLIDLVITSFGSAEHGHSDLETYLKKGAPKGLADLRREKWCGDVLYRPYNASEAIDVDTGRRAIVLYEIDQLRKLAARKDKHVVLVAGPCAREDCNKSRASALRPLLENPDLRVWNHLVLDAGTGLDLLPAD